MSPSGAPAGSPPGPAGVRTRRGAFLVLHREKKNAEWEQTRLEMAQAPREGDHIALKEGGPAYRVESVIFQPEGSDYDA